MLSITNTVRTEYLAQFLRALFLCTVLLGQGACSHQTESLAQVSNQQPVASLPKGVGDPARDGICHWYGD
jgi:hypothetical protein